jgi:hypothetical protein
MKQKGKAFKRALKTKDQHRLAGIPLIQDETVNVTPALAKQMLNRNKNNRPVNWNKVEAFKKDMEDGNWKFHAQGIILDNNGNLLTGQKRLWAIVLSGKSQYFRISRGSPQDTASLIDRGVPQTSRDLASRLTERKHSPTEQSIVRGILAHKGEIRPSADDIALEISKYDEILKLAMKNARGIKKTKQLLMILAAICLLGRKELFPEIEYLADLLEKGLYPADAKSCWKRGAAFPLAMEKAHALCESRKKQEN